MQTKQTFRMLDGIRGVAALLVVMRHTHTLFFPIEFQESYLAVDLFFLLSGVVICHSYEEKLKGSLSISQFSWIRLVRIYPLYIVGSSLGLIANFTSSTDDFFSLYTLLYTVLAIFLIPGLDPAGFPLNTPAWSLFFELLINFAYAFIVQFLRPTLLIGIMTISAVGLMISVYFSKRHNIDMGWSVRSYPSALLRVGYSFFAGILIYRLFTFFKTNRAFEALKESSLLPWLIFAGVAGMLAARPSEALQPYYELIAVILVFPPVILLSLSAKPQGFAEGLFKFLGAISYAVYAVHQPLGRLVQVVYKIVAGTDLANFSPWSGIMFMALLIFICTVLDGAYDAPVRRYLLSLGKSASQRKLKQLSTPT